MYIIKNIFWFFTWATISFYLSLVLYLLTVRLRLRAHCCWEFRHHKLIPCCNFNTPSFLLLLLLHAISIFACAMRDSWWCEVSDMNSPRSIRSCFLSLLPCSCPNLLLCLIQIAIRVFWICVCWSYSRSCQLDSIGNFWNFWAFFWAIGLELELEFVGGFDLLQIYLNLTLCIGQSPIYEGARRYFPANII